MTRGRSLVAIVLVLVVVGVVAITQLSPAQTVDDDNAQATQVASKQVVAAVAAESITEYEPDPFEPQRVRSSTVRVRRVALVYADGTIELQSVGK